MLGLDSQLLMDGFPLIFSQDTANMKNSWFFDKNFNGVSDEILGDVVEFFDFPLEDVETDGVEQDWNDQFKHLEEPSLGVFSVPAFELRGETQDEKPNLVNNFSAAVSFLLLSLLFGWTYFST
jgi:hypothetical protein